MMLVVGTRIHQSSTSTLFGPKLQYEFQIYKTHNRPPVFSFGGNSLEPFDNFGGKYHILSEIYELNI